MANHATTTTTMKARRIRLAELPTILSPRGARIRKVHSSDDVVITNVILEAGQELPAHVTPVDVFFQVVSGSGTVNVGDERLEASQGDIVTSPKGIPHGLSADHGETFSVLVVKTPNPEARSC